MSLDNYIYLLYNSDDKKTFNEKLALYNNSSNTINSNIAITLIVEKNLPASYIPFLHNNSDKNLENIIKEFEIKDDDYNKFYLNTICNTNKSCKDLFKNNLKFSIDNLNIPIKCYNNFNIYNLIYICIILWIIILCFILNEIYYYYKSIYTYILIIATIILLGIAVIFKMVSTIQE